MRRPKRCGFRRWNGMAKYKYKTKKGRKIMKKKFLMPTEQNRTDSIVVKAAIVFAVTYTTKEFFDFEVANAYVEALIIIAYPLYNIFAAYNNPKDKHNI